MDSISTFINKLKNASKANLSSFVFPSSKYILSVANALQKAGYLGEAVKRGKKGRMIEMQLIYTDAKPKVQGVKRVSLISRRLYRKASELKPVRNGYGTLILTTPKGIITDREARSLNVGGEPLFEIW